MSLNTLVIPAAGLGTRMRALTRSQARAMNHTDLPKEMLGLGGKPAIQYALALGRDAGVSRAVVVLRQGKEIIGQYLRGESPHMFPEACEELAGIREAMALRFVFQSEPLGEGDAISLCRDLVGQEPFAVVYPDNVHLFRLNRDSALAALASAQASLGADTLALMAVGEHNKRALCHSGRVDLREHSQGLYHISNFLLKTKGSFSPRFPGELRTCGIYTALPHYFDYIEQTRSEMGRPGPGNELTDGKVRRTMLGHGVSFFGLALSGEVCDVGNSLGYERCRNLLLEGEYSHLRSFPG
ncbi:MAG: hypothetical protein D6E12_07595 [Desulfovibrio sp.]|nr:MAG: hypothetical protein D6E12_07595 [Desulfovibrio sp.]